MAEVERTTVTRTEGTSDRSGVYTILGIILGVLIIGGVAFAIIGGPQIAAWWGNDSVSTGSSHTDTVVSPSGTSSTTTNTN